MKSLKLAVLALAIACALSYPSRAFAQPFCTYGTGGETECVCACVGDSCCYLYWDYTYCRDASTCFTINAEQRDGPDNTCNYVCCDTYWWECQPF
jgi:hypothetical protein